MYNDNNEDNTLFLLIILFDIFSTNICKIFRYAPVNIFMRKMNVPNKIQEINILDDSKKINYTVV